MPMLNGGNVHSLPRERQRREMQRRWKKWSRGLLIIRAHYQRPASPFGDPPPRLMRRRPEILRGDW